MFHEQRDFCAIAFRSPKIRNVGELWALLPQKTVEHAVPEDGMAGVAVPAGFDLVHAYYYSTAQFVFLDEEDLSTIRVRRGGKLLYRYDMYLMGLRVGETY